MRVVFDLAEGQISIQGDGPELMDVLKIAREIAPKLTHIHIETTRGQAAPSARAGDGSTPHNGTTKGTATIKSFIKSLHLDNTAEKIAAVAYYLKHHDNCDSFSPRDFSKWFTVAGLQRPAQMPVAFFGAKRRYGYITSVGHGTWRLDTQGENLITGKLNQAEGE